ncbi:MAG: hypothetical protein ACE5J2_05755 [Nitrososphaerales archaeon]
MTYLLILAITTLVSTLLIHQAMAEHEGELHIFTIESGKLIKVKSEVTNNTPDMLKLAYIVQIKDSDGVTVQISWMDGIKIASKEKVQAAQSWIPEEAGEYLVEIFVWESIANPDPMSPVRKAVAIVEA